MKIIVFGATGGTGKEIVKQGLNAGHEITAFVRNPAKVAIQHPQLKLVTSWILSRWRKWSWDRRQSSAHWDPPVRLCRE